MHLVFQSQISPCKSLTNCRYNHRWRDQMAKYEDKEAEELLNELDLPNLLPPTHQLVLNSELQIINLLSTDPARLIAQQQFSQNEWNLLLILFRSYPHYAPLELLLAGLTLLSSTECRQRLREAEQIGTEAVKRELKPVSRAMSAVRAAYHKCFPSLTKSTREDRLGVGGESTCEVPNPRIQFN